MEKLGLMSDAAPVALIGGGRSKAEAHVDLAAPQSTVRHAHRLDRHRIRR